MPTHSMSAAAEIGTDPSSSRRVGSERVPIGVDFGGGPLRILGGGTDVFGALVDVGVGVSA